MRRKSPDLQKEPLLGQKEFNLIHKNTRYDEFKVVCVAGQGTFGVVFKAEYKGNTVAIKITLQQKKYRNRELEVIEKLHHPNVVTILEQFYTYDNDNKYLNLVMDYYPHSLNQVIKRNFVDRIMFQPHQLKLISFQLFKALAYFEDMEVCHRDIKPHNILVDPATMETRICDFGSAKFIKGGEANVFYICSRFYRAPELLFGCEDYLHQIDMWSVGCVLVELLSLEPIFPGSSSLEQLIEIIKILGTPPVNESYLIEGEPLCFVSGVMRPIKWAKVLKFFKADPGYIDLISRILIFDRKSRLKAAEALVHPYFEDLWSSGYQPHIDKLPSLLSFPLDSLKGYPEQIQFLSKRSGRLGLDEKQSPAETHCCTPEQSR